MDPFDVVGAVCYVQMIAQVHIPRAEFDTVDELVTATLDAKAQTTTESAKEEPKQVGH
jgi:hypothetical protein